MSGVRAHIASRLRSSSLHAVPPPQTSAEYSTSLARAAASILYRSPIPSKEGRPIFILNAAALPDARESDFDSLLPYVLARLPEEDDLVKGSEYEVIIFAGDSDGTSSIKKDRPGLGWFIQAYHVLSRAMRKRLQRLYIVHEKTWVRILTQLFSTIASPKFKRKVVHASTLTALALHIPIEDLLIPPSAYLYDRHLSDSIFAPYASGKRAFRVRQPFPNDSSGRPRFPRVLRETTAFVLMENNITTEGLFRVNAHAKLKEALKEAYDRGQKFIVWKDNGVTLPVPPYPNAEDLEEIINEVDTKDAYGALLAAGLIKSWYADLHQPIFPHSTYRDLKRLFGDVDDTPTLDRLKDLFSPSSEWSFLPTVSREIVTRHLLPLLAAVAAKQSQNKMTAENLAVCFAPALLCGPDQLEDAKMSSIIRRVVAAATELWSQGLQEACGVGPNAFEEDLKLPADRRDWDDPLEGAVYHAAAAHEGDENLTNLVTGIILEDKEGNTEQPPPLPPRSANATRSSPTSEKSPIDSATRRKPAPPLMVPPRYSTIVSDGQDVAESPSSYAVTDGFAPPRPSQWENVADEKKSSGTSPTGGPPPPQISLPKRKALTAEQIDNAANANSSVQLRKGSGAGVALPGLTGISTRDAVKRKALPGSRDASISGDGISPTITVHTSPKEATLVASDSSLEPFPVSAPEFRRPSWPASANRIPNITSLARPVYPAPAPRTNRPPSKSTSLPVPAPKPRTPSPGLLQRMPSFEVSRSPSTSLTPSSAAPNKLNLKKASVDDLRRLYEERAGTAKTLVELGKRK